MRKTKSIYWIPEIKLLTLCTTNYERKSLSAASGLRSFGGNLLTLLLTLVVVVAVLLAHKAHCSLVEGAVRIGKSPFQFAGVGKVLLESSLVVETLFVVQSAVVVLLIGEVKLNGRLVVLALLVVQGRFVVGFNGEVSLGLAMLLDALGSSVQMIFLIRKCSLVGGRVMQRQLDRIPV